MENNSLKLNILYQFNNKYAPYAGVSIFSLLINNRHFDELNIYIFDDSQDPISQENQHKLRKMVSQFHRNITVLNTDKLIDIMKEVGIPPYRGSYSTNMKMFYSYLIPDSCDRLLYIDSDTIIDGKLDYFSILDFQNNYQAMVLDSVGQMHKFDIGLTENDNYFNAGVILFNTSLWKQDKCIEKIINHAKNVRAHYPAPDQDLLNIVLNKRILAIDPRYNFQPIHMVYTAEIYKNNYRMSNYYSIKELEEAKNNVIIYHCFRYLGEFPWHLNNLHPCSPIFDMYLKKSPWHNYIKKPASTGLIIKLEKLLYRLLPRKVFIKIFKICHRKFLISANKQSLKNKNDKKM